MEIDEEYIDKVKSLIEQKDAENGHGRCRRPDART